MDRKLFPFTHSSYRGGVDRDRSVELLCGERELISAYGNASFGAHQINPMTVFTLRVHCPADLQRRCGPVVHLDHCRGEIFHVEHPVPLWCPPVSSAKLLSSILVNQPPQPGMFFRLIIPHLAL